MSTRKQVVEAYFEDFVEEGDSIVTIGEGAATMKNGPVHRFAFADVFTFRGDAIRRVESYLVPLTAPTEG